VPIERAFRPTQSREWAWTGESGQAHNSTKYIVPSAHAARKPRLYKEEIAMNRRTCLAAAVLLAGSLAAGGPAIAQQKTFSKFGSFPPGTTPFIVNTAWANAVNKYVPGVEIQISATGAATQHMLMATEGKMDFFMGALSGYWLMYNQIGPFKKLTDGPARTRKMAMIFSYPLGVYHFVVYADSGIKSLKDIKGKTVFLGPPGGVATRNTELLIEAMTDYKPGRDYKQVKMGWGAAATAFQDRKFDVWIPTTNAPSPQVQQIALQNKIRLLGLDKSKFNHPAAKIYFGQPGRIVTEIAPDIYGKNLVNTEPVLATGAYVGLSTRADMPADLVYKMTKAFWEHIDEAWAMAPWMKNAVNLKLAVSAIAGRVHPGAARYYKERGLTPTVLDLDRPEDRAKYAPKK
jgi:TRAP transporter TAXI family solute receptor